MANLPKNSPDKVRALREMPYEEYLRSPWWRLRRHARLKQADGKCERCGKVISIADVHHVHYDRKGEERDRDLEVLCRDCHGKLHFDESRRQHIGQYEMLAREALRLDHPTSLAEFQDAFRTRLEYFHLPIDHRFHDAITIVWKKEAVSLANAAQREHLAAVQAVVPELPPPTHQEAVDLLRRVGLKVPVKSFPTEYGKGTGVDAIRQRAAARLKGERCPACRQTGTAIVSRVQPGWLLCGGCQHKWPMTVMEPIEKQGTDG